MSKQTKEQMLVELTKIRQSHEEWVAGDLKRRIEFARAFKWNKARKQYDFGEAELYEPTWIEIFVEVGKLKASRDFRDFEGNVSEMGCELEKLKHLLTEREK